MITVPQEQGSSTSLDNLQHEEDQDIEDGKDFKLLNLDETLFEQTSTDRKSKPTQQLSSMPLSSKRIKKVRSLPEKKRKGRDKKRFKHLKGYEGDILEGDDATTWLEDNMEGQALDHRVGQRTSEVSEGDQSDVSYEFTRSQNKSTKSVRFEDVEGGDSGHVTGSSTPYEGGRHPSEPDKLYKQQTKRRASAPECRRPSTGQSGRLLLEGGEPYDEDDYDDGDNRVTPSSTSLEQAYLEDGIVEGHDSDGDSEGTGRQSMYNSTRSIQTQSTVVEVHEDNSEWEVDASPDSKVPVAKLISTAERWKYSHRRENVGGAKLDSIQVAPDELSGKVSETRKKFTGGQLPAARESTLERRSKHLSRLVTETTKQLFPEPPRQSQPQHSHTGQLKDRQRSVSLGSTPSQPAPWQDGVDTDNRTRATTETSRTVEHDPSRQCTEPNPDDNHELVENCTSSEALLDVGASGSSLHAESLTSSPLRSSSPILPIPVFAAPFSRSSWKPSFLSNRNVAVPFSNLDQTDEDDDLDPFEVDGEMWATEVNNYEQDLLSSSGGSVSSGHETRAAEVISSFPSTSSEIVSVSPISWSMFGKSTLPAKKQTNEAFFYSADEPKQPSSKMVNQLPTIPEEGLETEYSATNVLQWCT